MIYIFGWPPVAVPGLGLANLLTSNPTMVKLATLVVIGVIGLANAKHGRLVYLLVFLLVALLLGRPDIVYELLNREAET